MTANQRPRTYGTLSVTIRPGAAPWAPPTSWWRALGAGLPCPQRIIVQPRSERAAAWAIDHEGRTPPGGPYAFRAYTLGGVTRVFVDDTETRASVGWLIVHELSHAFLNHEKVATALRAAPRPHDYATSDAAHERVVEEQVCNRVADILAPRMGGKAGLGRLWWRKRTCRVQADA